MMNLSNYIAPVKQIGDYNLTDDLNSAYKQVEDITIITNSVITDISNTKQQIQLLPKQGFFRGNWSGNTTYLMHDLATFNNILYAAKTNFTSSNTFNVDNWTALSSDANQAITEALAQRPTINDVTTQINESIGALDVANITSPSYITKSIEGLRGVIPIQPNITYWVSDKGQQGTWYQDNNDTTSKDNGATILVSENGIRLKRIYNEKLSVIWFGILPGNPALAKQNTLKLDAILKSNKSDYLFFPVNPDVNNDSVYYFDLLYLAQNKNKELYNQAAINLFDNNNKFEHERSVSIKIVTEGMGMQSLGLTTRSRPYFKNFTLVGTGGYQSKYLVIGYYNYMTNQFIDARPNQKSYESQLNDYKVIYSKNEFQVQTINNLAELKPNDYDSNGWWKLEYDDDWGNYENNGFNMWSATDADGLFISNFSGHGICGFGNTQNTNIEGPPIYFNAIVIKLDNGDFNLLTTDIYIKDEFNFNNQTTHIKLDLPGYVSGGTGGAYINNNGELQINIGSRNQEGLIEGINVVAKVYVRGLNLFADGGRLNNIEASFNGGCGVFTTGDECNTNTFINLGVNLNGAWGICDSSLLGNTFIAPKTASNGIHFNNLNFYQNFKLRIGGITNRNNQNARTIILGGYHEEDQAPSLLSRNTIDLGGVEGFGVFGGYGLGEGGLMRNLFSGAPGTSARIYYGGQFPGQLWVNAVNPINQISYFHEPSEFGFRIKDDQNHVYLEYTKSFSISNKIINKPSTIINNLILDGKVEYMINTTNDLILLPSEKFNQGDKAKLNNPTPELYEHLLCVIPGSNKNMQQGIVARGDGSDGIIFNQIPNGIEVGDAFEMSDGTLVVIFSSYINGRPREQGDGFIYYIGPTHPSLSNSFIPVEYARAKWKAIGNGTGTTAQRPDMNNIVAGWQYYNTTTNKLEIWTGTDWK